jgi:hypothetical protein
VETRHGDKVVRVAVRQSVDFKTSKQPIRTSSFLRWKETGDPEYGSITDERLPLIDLPDKNSQPFEKVVLEPASLKLRLDVMEPPAEVKAPTRVGLKIFDVKDARYLEVKDGVVLNHADCHGEKMDLVLFHELCHAYIWQRGIGAELLRSTPPTGTEPPWPWQRCRANFGGNRDVDPIENTEEQLVCGLLAGKGLRFCENTYRHQCEMAPRTQYSASSVSIIDPDVARGWPRSWKSATTTQRSVLVANGFRALADKLHLP